MLKPSMQDLMKRVNNRYLLVNLAAQRARDISIIDDENGAQLDEKPVKVALDEISSQKIEYRKGPKPQSEPVDILTAAAEDGDMDDALMLRDEEEEETKENPVDIMLEDL